MVKALPPQPHIDWLRKTAKDRLQELRAVEEETLRFLDRLGHPLQCFDYFLQGWGLYMGFTAQANASRASAG